MYLRAMTKSAMPTMITARLEAPPIQPWNFSRIIKEGMSGIPEAIVDGLA